MQQAVEVHLASQTRVAKLPHITAHNWRAERNANKLTVEACSSSESDFAYVWQDVFAMNGDLYERGIRVVCSRNTSSWQIDKHLPATSHSRRELQVESGCHSNKRCERWHRQKRIKPEPTTR